VFVIAPTVGLKPRRERRIFRDDKNQEHTFFRRGSKARDVMFSDLMAYKTSLRSANKEILKAKFIISFATFLLISYYVTADRNASELCWTNHEFSLVDIIPP
jgi:hypothetical protein